MKINLVGRKIYYDKNTFEVLTITNEVAGQGVVTTTVNQDFEAYSKLKERTKSSVGVIELEYGQYQQDFFECSDIRINPSTLALEFHYPDLDNPTNEPVFRKPLTVEIEELKQSQADLWELILFGGNSNV